MNINAFINIVDMVDAAELFIVKFCVFFSFPPHPLQPFFLASSQKKRNPVCRIPRLEFLQPIGLPISRQTTKQKTATF